MDFQRGLQLIADLGRHLAAQSDARSAAQLLCRMLAECLPIDACTITLVGPGNHFRYLFQDGHELDAALDLIPAASYEQGMSLVSSGFRLVATRQPAVPLLLSQVASGVPTAAGYAAEILVGTQQPNAYSDVDEQVIAAALHAVASWHRHLEHEGDPGAGAGAPAAPPATSSLDPTDARLEGVAAALSAISVTIAEEYPPEQVFDMILTQTAALVPVSDALVQVVDRGRLQYCVPHGQIMRELGERLGHLRIWRDYRLLDMSVGEDAPEMAGLFLEAGLRDFLSVPVLVNGAIAGRLTIASRTPRTYTSYHLHVCLLMAERISQVVRTEQLRESLDLARAKNAQLDILRHDFVSTVSHQLRTPLTGILGYMELLLNRWDSLDEERRHSMLMRAQSSAVRLEHLVTDLLLFSNLEHQELKLQVAPYPLQVLVDQAVESMGTKYRGQLIHVRPSRTTALVQADAQRAVQVIANLLDNAIKYSEVGSPVEVRWTVHRTEVEVLVRDYGPGIKPDDLPRLFTRFGTLGHHPRPGQVGTGIGLYVSKKLLDAMSGRIWATSRLGHGSIFHFTLPGATS